MKNKINNTEPVKKGKVNDIHVKITMFIGMIFAVAVFFFIPILIVKYLPWTKDLPSEGKTVVEGFVKIALFVAYVSLISRMKDIQRVFQYHGAEHKVINAYESGAELTVEGVINHTKVHVRCGTSFILVVLITSMVVFILLRLPWNNILLRLVYKLALLPIVAGIAYEIIKLSGKWKNSIFTKILLAPGLLMQKITTREPEPEMIEVAIAALKSVIAKEAEHEVI